MDADYPEHLLAREPAPPYEGEGSFALWHFSEAVVSSVTPTSLHRSSGEPQHLLYFFPLPHGHGSLRPTLTVRPTFPGDGTGFPSGVNGLAAGRSGFCRSRSACSPNCLASSGRPLSSHTSCSRSAMYTRSRTPGTR